MELPAVVTERKARTGGQSFDQPKRSLPKTLPLDETIVFGFGALKACLSSPKSSDSGVHECRGGRSKPLL